MLWAKATLGLSTAVLLGLAGRAARNGGHDGGRYPASAAEGRLRGRPATEQGALGPQEPGIRPLDAGRGGAEALLYVPRGYSPARAAPLVVLLHGAGSGARAGLEPLLRHADEAGTLLLAPKSERSTWDALHGRYGPDVASIDALLARVFARFEIDPSRVALGGFSDGASYALSLGLGNGDLFKQLIAFSPGFVPEYRRRGRPSVYVSHGTGDDVLPIERCSRRIAPSLRDAGYRVHYREFDGGHAVPADVAEQAIRWTLGTRQQTGFEPREGVGGPGSDA